MRSTGVVSGIVVILAVAVSIGVVMKKPDPEKAGRLVAEGKEILKAIYSPPPRPFGQEADSARKRAIKKFTQAIAADPKCAEAWESRGQERYFLHQIEDARDDMRKALALEPQDPDLYLFLASPFEGAEKRAILERGMALAGRENLYHAILRSNYVKTFWYEGDFARQARELEQWRAEPGTDPRTAAQILWSLACAYSALGREERAEEAYRAALPIQEGPMRGALITMVARTRMHRDDFVGALAVLDELGPELEGDECLVWEAALRVLAADGGAPSQPPRLHEALPAADRLASKPGPLGGTSYNTFLAGVLYAASGRTSEAKRGLEAYVREGEANTREWAVTQRWEIVKAKEILLRLPASDSK